MAKDQKNRSIEQNSVLNRLTSIWSSDLWEKQNCNAMEKGWSSVNGAGSTDYQYEKK